MTEQLKPCPFCGSTDLQMVIGDLCHWTECQKCEATGPAEFKDGDECDPTWNARANPSGGAISNAASPCSSKTEATGQFLKRFTTTL